MIKGKLNINLEFDDWAELLYKRIIEIGKKQSETPEFTIYIVDQHQPKSLAQLKYYWGVVLKEVSFETGYEAEDIHEYMKKEFGLRTISILGNVSFERIRGLSKMNKKEVSEFIEKVIRFWSEKGIIIPSVDQLTQDQIVNAEHANQTDW